MSKRDDGQWTDDIAFHKSPLSQSQPIQAKKPDGALPSKEKYEFEGKLLTPDIVETIFLQWSGCGDSAYLTIRKWSEYVRVYHEERGGLSNQGNLANIVGTALISIQRQGLARQKYSKDSPSGVWKIF